MKMKNIVLLTALFLCFVLMKTEPNDNGDLRVFAHEVFLRPPIEYYDSDGNVELSYDKEQLHRSNRALETCKIPPSPKNSYTVCKIFPSKVVCTQKCVFGHTFKDGVERELKCKQLENKWNPEFEECEPFVDCGITLGPGGKYTCYRGYIHQGPLCKLSCKRYEDLEALPPSMYRCDINGKWTPELPFCARPGTGIMLLPPPYQS